MKRPWDLSRRELEGVVEALQEAFYLDHDDKGRQVWDPDSDVPGADLVETMGLHLEARGLRPDRVLPADEVAAAADARELLRRLVDWAERTGGWEAKVWADARDFLDRDQGKTCGGCPSVGAADEHDAETEGSEPDDGRVPE